MKKNSSFPLLDIEPIGEQRNKMYNGDGTTKGNGGASNSNNKRRTNRPPERTVCRFDKVGCTNRNCRYAHAITRSPPLYDGLQMVPARSQMVPSGGHLQHAGNGFAQSLTDLCNFIVAPIHKRIDEVERTALGASVDATQAKEAAVKAQNAAESAIGSFREEMAKDRSDRKAERKADRKREAEEREELMRVQMKLMQAMLRQELKVQREAERDAELEAESEAESEAKRDDERDADLEAESEARREHKDTK